MDGGLGRCFVAQYDGASGRNVIFYSSRATFTFVLDLGRCGKSESEVGVRVIFRLVRIRMLGDAEVALKHLDKGMRALRGVSGKEEVS
jgi:hypothetical protein